MRLRAVPLAIAISLVAAACSGGSDSAEPGGSTTVDSRDGGMVAAVASYDLAVGPPRRFIVGLFDAERGNVGYGTLQLRFSFLGTKDGSAPSDPGPVATGTFLPLSGTEGSAAPQAPVLLRASEARGVYAASVGFDRPGFWEVEVTADVARLGTQTATAAFTVRPRHAVPAPGDPAPASENLTVSSPGAPPAAIDSRASPSQPVPDPELHQTTIAQTLRDRVPVLAVFSTPTFCVSRFCGPVTDMVADLARDYADRARFVHVEVWKDFEKKQLNDAAAQWLTSNGGEGNEPWVFLIGADGRVVARWDNVATRGEIEPLLKDLPPATKPG